MSIEIFARQSLAQFIIIYGEIFDEKAIKPSELEALMWGRMCAKDAGIVKTGFKIPYDNIKRAKVTLPYMPDDINYTGCCAIKKNGGLYTPCCGKVAEDATYCKSCSVDKEGESKEIEFGSIDDRDQNVEDGRFAPITFAEWMKAHKNMSLPEVYSKLRDAGIALEIPANELVCRELPKRRKGRPAKSDDSVVDEDSVEPKAKGKKAKEAPKKAKATKADSDNESESEVEAPKEVPKKKATPPASEDDAPKAKSPKTSPKASPAPSEDEAPKAKKSPKTSPKASPAPSEDEAPKAKKAKSPAASEDEAPKAKAEKPKAKKEKVKEPEPAPKKKAKPEASEDDAPKAKSEKKKAEKAEKAEKVKIPEPEPETLEAEEEEFEEFEDQEIEIGDKDYILRNGKFVIDKDDGRIVATVNEDGEPEWVEGEEP